jgi:hypothetical protein
MLPQSLDLDVACAVAGGHAEHEAVEKLQADQKSEAADGSSDDKAIDAEDLGGGMMRF